MKERHRLFILLLTVLNDVISSQGVILPVISNPRPYKDVTMKPIASGEIDAAFAAAQSKSKERATFESNMGENNGIMSESISAQARHQRNNVFQSKSRELDTEQETFQQASVYLRENKQLNNDQCTYGLPRIDLSRSANARRQVERCQDMFATSCGPDSKYRTADGSCNNRANPSWGKSFTCFARLMPPDYADGLASPRVAFDGSQLPNARVISLNVHTDLDIQSRSYTHMTMQWGQFLDHDMTITPMNRAGPNMDMIECCKTRGPLHPECFPIQLPRNDPFYSQFSETCMNFVRSASCTSDCTLGPRQQTNQLTAFIDGSNIYGSTENDTRSLREFRNGLLKVQSSRYGDLLPPSRDPENDQCSGIAQNRLCFQAGDERVNEQPGLTAMHTLWLRQHNNVATQFKKLFPRASDEQIFQETRRLIGAQLQMITYNEFLPTVLGPDYMKYFKLYPLDSGYTKYDEITQASIVHEFSTAAYRFGHTLIQNTFAAAGPNSNDAGGIDLQDNFFFPFDVFNGAVEPLLQGLFRQRAQQFDRHIVQAVTNHLYKQRGTPFGMDLPALNIQRGRDHGVRGYTQYLDYCFDMKIRSFNDLYKVMSEKNIQLLAQNYGHPDDIDLFTGGVAEDPLPGAVVGHTFGCIIGLQFFHLKFGDRYYFEHGRQRYSSFTTSQLEEIRKTTLAQIICQNTGGIVSQVQRIAFLPYHQRNNPALNCESMPHLDFRYWA